MKEIKENSFIFECHEVIQKSMCEQIINRFEEDKDGLLDDLNLDLLLGLKDSRR